MEGTRLTILLLLQRENRATVERIAQSLNLSPATVRRHLDILQRDRQVAYQVVRKRTGRPEHAYSLTELGQESLPKQYHRLLGLLLQQLENHAVVQSPSPGKAQDLLPDLFLRVSNQILRDRGDRLQDQTLAERLKLLRQVLEEEGFSPEVEETDGAVRFHLLNCPFRAVSLGNKAVCLIDSNLISRATSVPITRERWLHEGDHVCTYLVPLTTSVIPATASATVAP